MPTLVLLRHGQSQWNLENRFTGWWDVDLSDKGIDEARAAGALMRDTGLDFDCCFTSVLTRAIRTLHLGAPRDGPAVAAGDQGLAPQRAPLWRADRAQQAGDDRQGRRRTGQDLAPLVRHPAAAARPPTARISCRRRPPLRRRRGARQSESLKDTIDRVLPYYEAEIAPALRAGKRVLVAAHGNSLRALEKHLSDISDADIVGLEIPTGQPIVYELADDLSVERRYYLERSDVSARPPCAGTFPRRRGP